MAKATCSITLWAQPNRFEPKRLTFDREVDAVVRFWKKQGEPDYVDVTVEKQSLPKNSQDTDELLEDAIRLVVETGQASISMLQRRFRVDTAGLPFN